MAVGPSARALVDRYGSDVTAEQTLNPGLRRWRQPDAFVAYATGRTCPGGSLVRVTAGGPVCAPNRRGDVVAAFERDAATAGEAVAWFSVDGAQRQAMRAQGPMTDLAIGAQPVWTPARWPEIVASKATLRAQIHRAHNKGVRVERWATERVRAEPALAHLLAAWLGRRGLPPLRFLTDPHVLDTLGARQVLVAHRGDRPVGYLLLAPVAARGGVFVEWVIRSPEAPNGTAALLVDAAFRRANAVGARQLSMGLVPLSTYAPASDTVPRARVRALLTWMRAHARRFYNFEGLERFKAKFQPDAWEPLYLLMREPRISLGLLHAVADVFAGSRSPEALVGLALPNALSDEARAARLWLSSRGS